MKLSGQLHDPAALLPGKSPRYPLGRKLGGPHSRSGRDGEEKSLCPCQESNPGRPARNLATILTELLWLQIKSLKTVCFAATGQATVYISIILRGVGNAAFSDIIPLVHVPPRHATDQVSNPYKTAGDIIFCIFESLHL
jgi:hypothetical protein